MDMSVTHFMECKECSSKPGSPTLCEACLHNRSLLYTLRNKLRIHERALEEIKEILLRVEAEDL